MIYWQHSGTPKSAPLAQTFLVRLPPPASCINEPQRLPHVVRGWQACAHGQTAGAHSSEFILFYEIFQQMGGLTDSDIHIAFAAIVSWG